MKKAIGIIIIVLFTVTILHAQVRIKMREENGIYTTPCKVNGLQLRFIFDTGASNVCISLSEAIFMLKNGYLDEDDLLGSSYSQIANGEIIENTSINIRELEIGGIKLFDVRATIVHELSAPLLLGQSAIQKLGKLQIDGNELIIINANDNSEYESALRYRLAVGLCKEAFEYYSDELYYLALETYQKAYNHSPDGFECFDLLTFSFLYYNTGSYEKSIELSFEAEKCMDDKHGLYLLYQNVGDSYLKLENYSKARLFFEKAFTYSSNEEEGSTIYFYYGRIHLETKNYTEASKCFGYSAFLLEKFNKITEHDYIYGKYKNSTLGEIYYFQHMCYVSLDYKDKADKSAIRSAMLGYEDGIEYCKMFSLEYDKYFIKK